MPSSVLFNCYASLRLITDSGFLCMQCLAVLIVALFGFTFYENHGLRKICKCRIRNIWLTIVYPSFCASAHHLPKPNHSHLFSLPLVKDMYFNSGLFISSSLRSFELKQDRGCPGRTSKTDGVPLEWVTYSQTLTSFISGRLSLGKILIFVVFLMIYICVTELFLLQISNFSSV